MNRTDALAIGRRVQVHADGWTDRLLVNRIADELMKAFDAGAAEERAEHEQQNQRGAQAGVAGPSVPAEDGGAGRQSAGEAPCAADAPGEAAAYECP